LLTDAVEGLAYCVVVADGHVGGGHQTPGGLVPVSEHVFEFAGCLVGHRTEQLRGALVAEIGDQLGVVVGFELFDDSGHPVPFGALDKGFGGVFLSLVKYLSGYRVGEEGEDK